MNRKDRRRAQSLGAPNPSVMDPLAQAIAAHNAGRLGDAERIYREILRRAPDHVEALHLLGVLGHQAGHSAGGAEMIEKALTLKPNYAEAHFNLGLIRRAQGQKDKARGCFARALKIEPRYAEAANNLGALLKEEGDLEGAQAALEKATKARPDFLPAWVNLATIALECADTDTAQKAVARAKALTQEHPSVLAVEANLVLAEDRIEDAILLFRSALDKAPNDAEIWNGLGIACAQAFRRKDASDAFARALTLRLDYAEAHLNAGILAMDERRMDVAEQHIAAAAALQPGNALAQRLSGECAAAKGDMTAADQHFAKALALKSDYLSAYSLWTKARIDSCMWEDWTVRAQKLAELESAIPPSRAQEIHPFLSLYLSDSPKQHALTASRYARYLNGMHSQHALLPAPSKARDGRLRIGFFSADFRAHPVGQIVAGLFRHFDRERFKVHAYSFGSDDGSPIRQRIEKDVDVFVDVAGLSPLATATRIREDGIDVLIDLMGHTRDSRPKVLALKPAPLQVSWLYIGPTGMADIDYHLADPIALPESLSAPYGQTVAYLDGCLLPYDTEHAVIGSPMNRAEAGLPETGTVFCSFNAPQKLEPEMFSVWMRILARVPDAALWLLAPFPVVADNLRKEAQKCGIDPARLIFAPKLPKDQHLARHALADLFLDTRIYGAHLTALDSLWAGLPVLTCPGQSFASRIGASLLTEAGLPELIATDLADYEEKAVALGQNPSARVALKAKWQSLRPTSPLFDCQGFVRRFEKTISALWDRHAPPVRQNP